MDFLTASTVTKPGLGLLTFFIADAQTDEIITYFGPGDVIPHADLAGRSITIGAQLTDPEGSVGSVELTLGDTTRVENYPPFMLFGDNMLGDYGEGVLDLSAALQDMSVTIYEGRNKTGAVLDTFHVELAIRQDPEQPAPPLAADVLASQFDQIVFHFDGNNNDPDDIAALPIAALLADAAGIEDKTSFFYGNNLSQANEDGRLEALDAGGAFARSLGISSYNYQEDIDGTTARLVSMINSGQSVLILEGGPMDATYRALEQADPANLANVTLLSHSTWNQDATDIDNPSYPGLTETHSWADIRIEFPEVNFIEIADQNGGNNNFRGFYNQSWSWLDETGEPLYQDARAIMYLADEGVDAGKPNDPSDAGMLFYALTGEDDGTPADVEEYLSDPAAYTPNDEIASPILDGVSIGKNGNVVIEAETAELTGNWALSDVDGSTGDGLLIWDSPTDSFNQPQDTVSFKFTVDVDGDYYMSYRGWKPDTGENHDRNNDFFFRLKTADGEVLQDHTKVFFSGNSEQFLWGTTFESNHSFAPARFDDLVAGETYILELSGRSRQAGIDRIHLNEGEFDPSTYIIDGTENDDKLYGTDDPDIMNGLDGNDDLSGWNGADVLTGGRGKDILRGHIGDDTLYGDQGADTLVGGPGADTLYGGWGKDQFVFYGPDLINLRDVGWDVRALDVIEDFQLGVDTIKFGSSLGIDSMSQLKIKVHDFDGDTYVSVRVKETKDAFLVNVDDTIETSEQFVAEDPFIF
ncbi:hypothetical protein E1180_09960 [Roseibium denhamense]|uniref:Hemolysin-type calcium-binding repeat-containing protein n=1 Tax=Roseibium denhamense TaxID=76305 RepID=A0ABY1PJ23_9HYPH|nr:hypothetical protein [Roseibium denhamense]MTI05836.1 hypothetical protein [Roseibium denhamense]SMP35459.1 Hemolysin-type calcium-binding repeat-containing protein [Roseibium denhamense]